MRICFMGTPAFSCASLQALSEHHEIVQVVTAPDAVRGRGGTPQPSAVKKLAEKLELDVIETKKITPELVSLLGSKQPDAICVAAFGALLPQSLLEIPPFGCFNVHASLLPRWRGAAPIERAILAGDKKVGISIMKVVKELDAGDFCSRASVMVDDKTADQLREELAKIGALKLLDALEDTEQGHIVWTPQNPAAVTYAAKLSKEEMYLSPDWTALDCVLHVQASSDTCPARIMVNNKTLRIVRACASHRNLASGLVEKHHKHIYFGCADGSFEALLLKPDGKREMSAAAWYAGQHEQQKLTWKQL